MGAAPFHGVAYTGDIGWRLRWAPALTARIRRLHRDGIVEVRWCSTWCSWPDELVRVLKMPGLDLAFGDVVDTSAAKLAAARTVLATGRRLVWTDDVEVPLDGPLHDELTGGGTALLIRPDPRRGLTPAHLTEIEAFALGEDAQAAVIE